VNQATRTGFTVLRFCLPFLVVVFIRSYPGPWNLTRWIGLVIAVFSSVLLLVAHLQLGGSFSVTPQARHLVTGGLYSKFRNPIYIFGGLLIFGLILPLNRPSLWIIFMIAIPIQIARAHKEANVLEEKFGDEYREYCKKTWF